MKHLWKLLKSELNKAPIPYESTAGFEQFEPVKGNVKKESFIELPNGYKYARYIDTTAEAPDGYKAWDHHHYLVNPYGRTVAEIRTKVDSIHPDKPSSPRANTVRWSQVDPEHAGKGYGKMLMGAIAIHPPNKLPIASDTEISPNAHKAWKSFFKAPGFGGRLAPYSLDYEKLRQGFDKYRSRHVLFIRDRNKAMQHIFGSHQQEDPKKLAASEDKIPGGKGDNYRNYNFPKKQIDMGRKIELEHTNNRALAEEIARDHLAENKKYYTKLKQAGLADELKKAPYIKEQPGMNRPHNVSVYEGIDKIYTYDAGVFQSHPENLNTRHVNGLPLYHHVFEKSKVGNDYIPALHVVSFEKDPHAAADNPIISSSVGEKTAIPEHARDAWDKHYQTGSPFSEGRMASIGETIARPSWRGAGLGHKLYEGILNHHGKLISDQSVSPAANAIWKKLITKPGVTGQMGPENQAGVNWAHHVGEKRKPISIIDYSGKNMHSTDYGKKLAASELEKAPTHYDIDDNDSVAISPYPGFKPSKSYDVGGGLTHRVWTNPKKPNSTVHTLHGAKSKDVLAQIHVENRKHDDTEDIEPTVSHSVVNPKFKGRGFGQKLYLGAAKHHGSIASDSSISRRANAMWNRMKRKKDFSVSLADFNDYDETPHRMSYYGSDKKYVLKSELEKGVKSPSKHIPLSRLKQIKQDNYVGEGGKDYSQEEVENQITARMQSEMEKEGRRKEEIPSDKNRSDYSWMFTRNSPFGLKIKKSTEATLQKSMKDVKNMLPGPEHQEHVNWVKKLPNSNWQVWAAREYKKNPTSFSPEVKQEIEHFAGSQHIPNIAKIRFEKHHDLKTGIGMLKEAQNQYLDSISKNKNIVTPSPKTQKVVHIPDSTTHWYGLGVGACKAEGSAMGHCGNVPSKVKGDRVLSLRTEHKINNKTYHEPHLTFISNNGFLGEMKGRGNEKPGKHYHKHIVELLKNPNVKGLIGGGYQEKNNFQFSDLSSENQKEVLKHNPNLIYDATSDSNVEKILSTKMPNKYEDIKRAIAQNPNLHERHHEKLVNDEFSVVREAAKRELSRRKDSSLLQGNKDE